jgi:DNA-binding CsgD family transcriptional regulator
VVANIAERLSITVGTIKNHRRRICEKLTINHRAVPAVFQPWTEK